MPQFDLANASVSASFVDNIMYPDEGFVPYIYDDKYPAIIGEVQAQTLGIKDDLHDPTYDANGVYYWHLDPYNTSEFTNGSRLYQRRENYKSSNTGISGSRLPYNPDIHSVISGTLTIGLGVTNLAYNMTPTEFFDAIYKTGIDIGGTTYTFPAQFNSSLVNS